MGQFEALYGVKGQEPVPGGFAMPHSRISLGFAAAALLALTMQYQARADTGAKVVEEVDFATSCSPAVQHEFKHAVWTLHSFWYPEALKEFTTVTQADPNCSIGYWGIAMSHWYPLWYPPNPAALKAGSEAVEQAMAAPTKTEREKDYIAAIAAFYRDNDKLDHRARALAYEKAMEQVYLKYPEDREAGVFYALALNATALPTDQTFANKRKAAEILNKVWKEQPNHPGVVHYLIHSDDSAQFAQAGLDAAICYAKIAPDVPHALHMPSHIFTRLGMWRESIDSNSAANAAALAYVRKSLGPDGFDGETVHTMDYLEYAYLQTAEDGPAKAVVDQLVSFHQSAGANLPSAYAIAAIPVRYALERRDWQAATSLSAPAIGFPLEHFPWAEAMISYARALGDARTGNIAGAQTEITQLQSLKDKLLAGKDTYWANQVEVQRLGAAGVLAHVQGDNKKAIELVRAAADLEATMDKHPATPSSVLPARELLGDLLLELNQPDAALVEYKEMLRTDPNRFRSILGEARAAKQAGDTAAAHDAYQKLVALSKSTGPERPELAEAKAYLTN
jgi:tetratricopeptide (TPR) repeat protein